MAHITTNPAEFASASNAVSRFFSAFGKALVALGNSESRVRQAQALYALSDAELAERGLRRTEIAHYVFADRYWG